MILYLIFAVFFAALFLASHTLETEEKTGWRRLMVPFTKMAMWISRRVSRGTEHDITRQTEKWRLVLIILFCGFLCLPLLDAVTTQKERQVPDQVLERPKKGEGTKDLELVAQMEDVRQEITVSLEERQLTDSEEQKLLQDAREEIYEIAVGGNESASDVRGVVRLPSSAQDGEVTVQWLQEPQGLLDEDGNITDELPDNGEVLVLTALLSCGDTEQSYSFALHLMPREMTKEEEMLWELQKAVRQSQQESMQQEEMKLPDEVMEKKIGWSYSGSSMTELCFLGIFLLAAAGYAGKTQEYINAEKKRKQQLLLDYSDVVFKLGMLLNAGLTIQNAFSKIALEYRENRNDQKKRYVYEEMNVACNEMKSGISEANAYENFGKRCALPCYVRLGNLLAGGLQKSAEGLTDLLLKEAQSAMEERRQLARKLGEEAGTRLLFPMILMLLVVMVILMVPAMLSF